MKIVKAFKYQLKTNKEVEQKLQEFCDITRCVWNLMLAKNIVRLEKKELIMYYYEMSFWATFLKKTDEYSFLKECPAQVIQQKLKDQEKAFRDFFDKKQIYKGFPKFKKKNIDHNNSFRYPQGVKVNEDQVFLPKIGWVRFRKSRDIVGKIKNTTITTRADKWYISFQTEYEKEVISVKKKQEIAIDLGIDSFATLSNGQQLTWSSSFKQNKSKLAIVQRQLSRKIKHSNNFKKHKKKINKIHQKISNSRKDFLHKTATKLTEEYNVIYLEGLKVRNMSRSAKGTIENPGRNIKQKSGLNRSILDQGWSEFSTMLEYKLKHKAGQLITIDPKYTSQICNKCGHKDKENRKSQSVFICQKCQYQEHADINAALNIMAVGQTVSACESNLIRGRKQESPSL